ncbi:MAG TPA: LysR family transcriptional regulator [Magnetospirillaceae bacterium]|nr:LysR family transcriptional regulator [Magnetospirillaceae bacterium]
MADPIRQITLRQMRALSAVAHSRNVTEAAGRLGLTQPAVTLQLKNLEDLAGLPILQRTPEGMVPTQAGAALLRLHDRMEAALGDCANALDMMKGLTGGRVSIGAVSTAKYFAPFVIAEFARQHPAIELKLTIGNREDVLQGLRDYSLDLAISGRPPADLDLDKRLIGDHPHVVIGPAHHPLAKLDHVDLRALADETFIIREQGSGTRMLMEHMMRETGLTPRIGMEISSNETIKQAVMAGLGISFISAHTVAGEIGDGRLAVLHVEGLPLVRQWYVVRRADKALLPPAEALMDFLGAEAARFLPAVL